MEADFGFGGWRWRLKERAEFLVDVAERAMFRKGEGQILPVMATPGF